MASPSFELMTVSNQFSATASLGFQFTDFITAPSLSLKSILLPQLA